MCLEKRSAGVSTTHAYAELLEVVGVAGRVEATLLQRLPHLVPLVQLSDGRLKHRATTRGCIGIGITKCRAKENKTLSGKNKASKQYVC